MDNIDQIKKNIKSQLIFFLIQHVSDENLTDENYIDTQIKKADEISNYILKLCHDEINDNHFLYNEQINFILNNINDIKDVYDKINSKSIENIENVYESLTEEEKNFFWLNTYNSTFSKTPRGLLNIQMNELLKSINVYEMFLNCNKVSVNKNLEETKKKYLTGDNISAKKHSKTLCCSGGLKQNKFKNKNTKHSSRNKLKKQMKNKYSKHKKL
jgi:hypothetical protein